MKKNIVFPSYPSIIQLTGRREQLKTSIDSIKDVFLIGCGDQKLFKDLQDYQEEFDQLDHLIKVIYLAHPAQIYGKYHLSVA
jgi:hypothetical protein